MQKADLMIIKMAKLDTDGWTDLSPSIVEHHVPAGIEMKRRQAEEGDLANGNADKLLQGQRIKILLANLPVMGCTRNPRTRLRAHSRCQGSGRSRGHSATLQNLANGIGQNTPQNPLKRWRGAAWFPTFHEAHS
jgi:hypothetical protein